MTKITNIQLLGEPLPIAGKHYCVGRITGISGDIPKEIAALKYPVGKEQVSPIDVNNVMKNMGAVYLFVELLTGEEESESVDSRIIENYDDFLTPFELPDKERGQFEEYFLNKRCSDAMVKHFLMQIEDEDAPNKSTTCIAFYNVEEMAYIAAPQEKLSEMFRPDKIASLQSDTPVRMVFADSLTRAVDVHNQIYFYDKAKDIAKIISEVRAINQNGVKDSLTMTAVDDLFTMVKKELRVK